MWIIVDSLFLRFDLSFSNSGLDAEYLPGTTNPCGENVIE